MSELRDTSPREIRRALRDLRRLVDPNTSARHAESHSIASHNDTTATGAEFEELTDGSETTLHTHAGGVGGIGDVVGPTGATDDHLASYDGATGKLIQDSGLTTAEVTANSAHVAGDGSDHADVASNNTHRGSAGTDHSDVGLNNTHRAGGGSDHADVAANTAASHAESHTVASHSDTSATGAELETLTDGSSTTLHKHASIDADFIHLTKTNGGLVDNMGGANGTVVPIRWDSELHKDSTFTHSNSTNPEQIAVGSAGRYSIVGTVSGYTNGGSRTTLQLYVDVGGTDNKKCSARNYTRGQVYGQLSMNISTEMDLSSSDVIKLETVVDDTDAVYTIYTQYDECELIIRKIG